MANPNPGAGPRDATPIQPALARPFLLRFARQLTGRVLDCGGGHGVFRSCLPPDTLTLDVDSRTLRGLSGRRVAGDGLALPFAAATFDGVWACAIAPYVSEPDTLIRECVRVLRPGGRLLLFTPNRASPLDAIRRLLGMRTWNDLDGVRRQLSLAELRPYGATIVGEIRPLPWLNPLAARFPALGHALMLDLRAPEASPPAVTTGTP